MACTSIANLALTCERKGVIAGVSKVYGLSFKDVYDNPVFNDGLVYTMSPGGYVDGIYMVDGKVFREIGALRNTISVEEILTKTPEIGGGFITQTLRLSISGMSAETTTWLNNIIQQYVIIIIETRTGYFFALGLNGYLELTGLQGGTGTTEGDLIGYNLTFTATSLVSILPVDPTLIPIITAPPSGETDGDLNHILNHIL